MILTFAAVSRSSIPDPDKDLYYCPQIVAHVQVDDSVFQLMGTISDSESENDQNLESYLLGESKTNTDCSSSQSMARTKQTQRGSRRGLPPARGGWGGGDGRSRHRSRSPLSPGASSGDASPRRGRRRRDDSSSSPERSGNEGGASPRRGKRPRQPIAAKNIRIQAAPPRKRTGFALTAFWNRSAKRNMAGESERGWLEKAKRTRNDQGRILRRHRPGVVALREIRFYQKTCVLLLPVAAFLRCCREESANYRVDLRWQAKALFLLQQAAEAYVVGFLSGVNLAAIHCKRETIMVKDMHLVRKLREHAPVGVGLSDDSMA